MLADQPINVNVAGLPNSMASVLSLCIHGGIPVAVVEYDSVRSCQVNAHTAASRREDETEYTRIIVEAIHELLTMLNLGRPIQSKVRKAVIRQKLLLKEGLFWQCKQDRAQGTNENVKHSGHLREN